MKQEFTLIEEFGDILKEITLGKYYEAIIERESKSGDYKSISLVNDLGKMRTYKRELFETRRERRERKLKQIL
jgi:hypothetical protein